MLMQVMIRKSWPEERSKNGLGVFLLSSLLDG